jgi:hypothetical protein
MTTPYDPSGVHPVIGVDAGTTTLREADHLIRDLTTTLGLPPGTVACTHLIRTEGRRGTAVSLALPEPKGSAEEVWQRLTATEMGAALDDRRHGPSEAAAWPRPSTPRADPAERFFSPARIASPARSRWPTSCN